MKRVFLLMAVLLVFPSGGQAQQAPEKGTTPFRLGAVDIFPGFTAGVSFDDNIFLTQRNEESDTIFHYIPSVALNLPFAAASSASLRALVDILDFSDNNREDTENLIVEGGLNLERIFGRYYSRTSGGWRDTSETASSEEESAIGARSQRTIASVRTAAGFGGYEEDKGRIEINGGYSEIRFDRSVDKRLDENVFFVGALGDYKISPKTAVRLEYIFSRSEFDNRLPTDQRDDSNSHVVRAGLAFSPGALVTGHATFGVEFRDYDKTITPTSTSDRDTSGFNADVDLTWRVRPEITEIRGRFSSYLDTAATAGQFGLRTYIGEIGISQALLFISEFLKGYVAYSIEKNDFLRSRRDDTIDRFEAKLTYTRKIANLPLFGSVGYVFAKRDSNVSLNDYENNIISFQLGIQY